MMPLLTIHPIPAGAALTASALLAALPLAADDSDAALTTPEPQGCSARYSEVVHHRPASDAATPKQAVRRGFDTQRDWGTEHNVEVLAAHDGGLDQPVLRVHYPAGTSSPGDDGNGRGRGGAGFYTQDAALAGADRVCLRYQVRFAEDFDFVRGGKLPGLYGGEGPSGGEAADGDNGFSMRFMWREQGQGELYEYVVNQDEDHGASVGRGLWHFPTGHWISVEQEVVLNHPDRDDGVARVWIDGEPVLEQHGIVYRTSQDVDIEGVMFSTFFGGHGEGWRTPRDQHADFGDFRLYTPGS
ncbi:polysaccharide lyase [Franzmannia qiaohouensis]|uniref:Polysaccharide lyase 14 domain-containing protein n=1 Tax=Franzmannia qiaohouensis TaxID=1329370 RepID=A0ABU1H9T9_9GAMM|nr:hypothetical protein [Halomonas qiaohouensis]MDR5904225.1 hypothetical protein [Halomonas qiaohouensis]